MAKTKEAKIMDGIKDAENSAADTKAEVTTLEAHPHTDGFEPTHKATKEALYHKPGEPIRASKTVIDRMVAMGHAVPLMLAFVMLSCVVSFGQITAVKMKTSLNKDSAIVTNTGTGSLILGLSVKQCLSIQANFVKVSGTVGGTVTLYGSNDGTNYVALTDATSAPTITTYTATDAGTYSTPIVTKWFLKDHEMKYYKLTWAGTGTMVGYFKAWLLAN